MINMTGKEFMIVGCVMHAKWREAMGFFSKLLRKTPENVTAHIINPNSGYQTKSWTVGTDVFRRYCFTLGGRRKCLCGSCI